MNGDRQQAVRLGLGLGRSTRIAAIVLASAMAAVAVGACGSSDSSSTGSTATTGAGNMSASQAAAAKVAASYMGKPTPFPVTEPLKTAPKPGLKVAMMDCGTGVCAAIRALAEPAVKAAGGKLIDVKAGTSAAPQRAVGTRKECGADGCPWRDSPRQAL